MTAKTFEECLRNLDLASLEGAERSRAMAVYWVATRHGQASRDAEVAALVDAARYFKELSGSNDAELVWAGAIDRTKFNKHSATLAKYEKGGKDDA